jgi:hypothetical protein
VSIASKSNKKMRNKISINLQYKNIKNEERKSSPNPRGEEEKSGKAVSFPVSIETTKHQNHKAQEHQKTSKTKQKSPRTYNYWCSVVVQ